MKRFSLYTQAADVLAKVGEAFAKVASGVSASSIVLSAVGFGISNITF